MHFPAPDESIWVGILRLSLRVPGARSLKEKRRAIHQVRDRLKARHAVSVAEVGHLEDHQRSILCVTKVANEQRHVQSVLDSITHEVSTWRTALVEDAEVHILRPWDD